MRILVVEDDRRLNDLVKRSLVKEGYSVDSAYEGEEAQYLAETNQYDVVILDWMLPGKSGIQVCRDLRANGITSPVLMLTGKADVDSRVEGLDSGADDYLTKPFHLVELLARIRTLLRRQSACKTNELKVGDLVMDTVAREVRLGSRPIRLTSKEYAVLEYLMRHPNTLVTREVLEEHAWDQEFDSMSNVVDVYIHRLRRKIGRNCKGCTLATVRGAGYRLSATS